MEPSDRQMDHPTNPKASSPEAHLEKPLSEVTMANSMSLLEAHLQLRTPSFRHQHSKVGMFTVHLKHHATETGLLDFRVEFDNPQVLILWPAQKPSPQHLLADLLREGELCTVTVVGVSVGTMHRARSITQGRCGNFVFDLNFLHPLSGN